MIEKDQNGFHISHEGKILFTHSAANPFIYIGRGDSRIEAYRGNFQVDDYLTERTPLRDWEMDGDTVKIFTPDHENFLTLSFTVKERRLHFTAAFSDTSINRIWLRLPAEKEEHIYGGGEQFSYHKSSEIDVAFTPLVLLLAKVQSIENNKLDTSCVEGFYLPKGTAVELYATTLHFSPCKVSDEGFKCIVILPNGTNESLPQLPHNPIAEEQLLWMRNKWLLAHPESAPAAKGAWVGLTGENLKLYYK